MVAWYVALAAGALFGAAAGALLVFNGRIAGIGGIAAQALEAPRADHGFRLWFIAGLLAGGALLARVDPEALRTLPATSSAGLVLAGLLIGFGARLGNGCTSGHGVCGVGRLSVRSLVAVSLFSGIGALTYALLRTLGARS
jgi:uncharacterized membrane protein YedE/YeeE